MWKRTDEEPSMMTEAKQSKELSVINCALLVKGELSGEEDLLVEGKVEGTINLPNHCVTVGEHGSVAGDIYAQVIHVRGELHGDMYASEQVVVHETGSLRGNITAPRVCLENGAKLKGTIDMDPQPTSSFMQAILQGAEQAKEKVEQLQSAELADVPRDGVAVERWNM
jgi:cytoskeletal protein CcmA (bactofilin family)